MRGTSAGGSPRGRPGNPAGGAVAATTSTALPGFCSPGEGEALTRKAVELALAGDPAALRLCLERIVGPYRECAVEFTMPPIRNAVDLGGPKGKS